MPPSFNSPEFKLLLSCRRIIPSKFELDERADALRQGIDEKYFLNLVKRHLIAPIVFKNLYNEKGISDELKTALKYIVHQNQYKALAAKQMIVRLQKKFVELDVNALFLKGVPVAELYYGDVGLRDTMDIDVWVEPSGFIKVCEYLQSVGYRSNLDLSKLNRKQVEYKYKTDHHLLFRNDDPSYPELIELHWKIRGRLGIFTFDPNSQYHEVEYYNDLGTPIPILSDIDNLLFLCTHGCDHAWYRLKWLFDVPQLLEKVNFNWREVLKRAELLNCVEQVKLTFLLLNKLFQHPIPPEFNQPSVKYNLRWSLNYIEHSISYNRNFCDTDKEKLHNLFYTLLQNKKGILNTTIILRHLTSENDWKLLPLPEHLFFLYFPLRPFLMLWRRFF